jgi:hypothetical protein
MERLGAGPPWNSSASAMRGASLCQERVVSQHAPCSDLAVTRLVAP